MAWVVAFADDFESEFDALSQDVQDAIFARIVLLEREAGGSGGHTSTP